MTEITSRGTRYDLSASCDGALVCKSGGKVIVSTATELEPETEALWLEMYRKMVRIRHFERSAYELYMAGKLPGFMHISIGQEAR
jgi:TPP-dependent pyruvate/acetoin dehydrogenase alpha subunit